MFGNSLKISCLIILGGLLLCVGSRAQTPSLVILNADIRTMDSQKPRAQAVAITGNRISAVGTNSEISALVGDITETIDANAKLVIPGFNDSHVHFSSVGAQFFSVNLKNVETPDEVIQKLKRHTEFLPKGQWIIGGFQTNEDYPLKIIPSKEVIDSITPGHPVLIYLKGVQTVFANSLALKLAGTDKFKDEILTTGILRDSAVDLVRNVMPVSNLSDQSALLEAASRYAASVGVTSVQDVHSDDIFELLRQLEQQGKLKTRVYECISLRDSQKLIGRGIRRASGDSMIREGCLKYYSDGDPEQLPEMERLILTADKAEIQVMMHAIGASANNIVLTIFENVLKKHGAKDRRFRIEHAHNFLSSDLDRFIATNTVASMQPYLFFRRNGNDSRLFRQMLDARALLSFGSDANIVELDPLLGIYASVYGANSNKGMTVEEAVYAYTQGPAYAEFQERIKGSITVGKLADLIILSDNIFTIDRNEIDKVRVLRTIVDGRTVYSAQ